MIVDARKGSAPSRIDCDLCIVGAGAAGLAVARALADTSLSICILEAGGLRLGRAHRNMLQGETGDSDYPPLHTVRTAGLGGCMRVWAGWCRPLDAIDFERREHVPHSGWPFGVEELRPYYVQAHELLGLGPLDYDPAGWEAKSGMRRLRLGNGDFASVLFRQSAVNLGARERVALERAGRVRLMLHANVMRLRYAPSGEAVEAVDGATLNGRRFEIHARDFVVAGGGIETARLLLLSAEGAGGVANPRGLVGRFFMEHGCDDGWSFAPASAQMPLGYYNAGAATDGGGRRVARGAFAPTAETLRREGLLNCAICLRPAYEADPVFANPRVRAGLELWDMLRSRAVPADQLRKAVYGLSAPRALSRALWRRLDPRAPPAGPLRVLSLFECAPDPDNRIVLGEGRDALGRPVARLEWKMRDPELESLARAYRLFDENLRAAGLGRLEPKISAPGDEPIRRGAVGQHHLGTTRMDPDPARGVVDANARVHGVDNLFIAGGSVFPSGGFANPTLTVVALSLRLAAHLRQRPRAPL